jgi:hypothetical protein
LLATWLEHPAWVFELSSLPPAFALALWPGRLAGRGTKVPAVPLYPFASSYIFKKSSSKKISSRARACLLLLFNLITV